MAKSLCSEKITAHYHEQEGQMSDIVDSEKLAHRQAVLAHWDIPPVTSIADVLIIVRIGWQCDGAQM
jgi:hypothetical protein